MQNLLAFFALALFTAACTQQPVGAIYKGGNQYGKTNIVTNRTYSDAKPEFFSTSNVERVSYDTSASAAPSHVQAPVQSVTVAPLTPISINDAAPITKAAPPVKTEKHSSAAGFIWPAEGKVISSYGSKAGGKFNDGINIAAAEGEPIWAAADGTVIYSGNQLKGYGNMALIQHDKDRVSSYAHASKFLVKKGDKVKQGQLIGYVGRTGGVDTAQLHFSLREGKTPVNPSQYLSQSFASN